MFRGWERTALSAVNAGEGVASVEFTEDSLIVGLVDGRRISDPLEWYPRQAHATPKQLGVWEICGGGYGIHWPELDEDLSTAGLCAGRLGQKLGRSRRPRDNVGPRKSA